MSKEKVYEIVADAGHCTMATCVNGQPRVRPMKFVVTDKFEFWASTVDISGKVKEFELNNKVELCWVDSRKNHLRVEGIVRIVDSIEKKEKLFKLHPGAERMFKTADNPSLLLVEVVPKRVRWKIHSFGEYNEVPLN